MVTRRSNRSILIGLSALVLLTAADLYTKQLAVEALSQEALHTGPGPCEPDASDRIYMQRNRSGEVVLIENFLELRYTENCGAAFGMLHDAPRWLRYGLFMTAAAIAVAVLLWMFVRGSGGALFAASVPLVASGALGNLVDRVRHIYVVDFIRFHIYDVFEWPTFNVADSAITVGVILLLLDGFRREVVDKKTGS